MSYPTRNQPKKPAQETAFRRLTAANQEEIGETNYTTLIRIQDEATVDDILETWTEAKQVASFDLTDMNRRQSTG